MRKKLGTLLVEDQIITSQQLKFALLEQLRNKKSKRLGEVLVELGFAKKDDIEKTLAENSEPSETNLPAKIPEKSSKTSKEKGVIKKRTSSSKKVSGEEEKAFQQIIAPDSKVEVSYKPKTKVSAEETSSDSPVIRMQELIFSKAIKERASDIHLEPRPNILQVRFRIDGLLREVFKIPKWMQDALTARIKILGKLDISEKRLPQDGKYRVDLGDKKVDLRLSTLPTSYGEKIVLRILDSASTVPSLEEAGLEGEDLLKINSFIERSLGMILVVGPTGSGKSSTLYAMINKLKSESLNIVTIEDPIEIQVEDVNQVQVNDKVGLSFASCLRSVLRQDPDVILVGEIRDEETAEIAFKAANTGHLVLSTLHTNSAPATITRLFHLNVEPYLIASSLIGIISQRLVRLNCSQCMEIYDPPQDVLIRLGINGDLSLKSFRGKGCPVCDNKGYFGRQGLFQILDINSQLQELIAKQADERIIKTTAIERGMKELKQIGLEKVENGLTTLEEVLRVCYFREENNRVCPGCKKEVEDDFLSCPYCEYKFIYQCRVCHKPLQNNWSACPYCSAASPPQET
jgi:type IV pilus assembly protein PilB